MSYEVGAQIMLLSEKDQSCEWLITVTCNLSVFSFGLEVVEESNSVS